MLVEIISNRPQVPQKGAFRRQTSKDRLRTDSERSYHAFGMDVKTSYIFQKSRWKYNFINETKIHCKDLVVEGCND